MKDKINKECKHNTICDAGYNRKRCTCCDKIINEAEIDTNHSDAGNRDN